MRIPFYEITDINKQDNNQPPNSGFALLIVIFIIGLATILVSIFSSETFAFLKRNRSISSSLESEYVAKSALILALSTLEMPDDPSMPLKPWQILNSMEQIPIPGYLGEVRVQIFDESGKINLNAIASSAAGFPGGNFRPGENNPPEGEEQGVADVHDFWKFTVAELFSTLGLGSSGISTNQQNSSPQERTLGGTSFPPEQQVAVLHDWIDADTQAFSSPHFSAQGIEGGENQTWFLNRPLQILDELARVPGFTNDFLQRLAPFVRVATSSDFRINVNTAPPLVLQVIGFSQDELQRIIQQRSIQWLTTEELQTMVQGAINLSKVTTVSSSQFKIIVRVRSITATKWLEADTRLQSGFGKKVASIQKIRFY